MHDATALASDVPPVLGSLRDGPRVVRVPRLTDLGLLTFAASGGATATRLFARECHVGAFPAAGLPATALPMSVRVDDGPEWRLDLLGLVVSNEARSAGGLLLAPDARADDGWLDLLLIHDMPERDRARFLARVARGAHVGLDGLTTLKMRRVSVVAPPGVAVAADGERLGRTPCAIEVRARVLASARA